MKKYDYLIVGAGLFGAVFACEMKKTGKIPEFRPARNENYRPTDPKNNRRIA